MSTIKGDGRRNILIGSEADDLIWGYAGNDDLLGGGCHDTLHGGDGIDLLDGGAMADVMHGGRGDDLYVVEDAADQVVEALGAGSDLVRASLDYLLGAHVENLLLEGDAKSGTGNALDNRISGNAHLNTLTGGDGNDLLDGKSGGDRLAGGLGDDSYVIGSAGDKVTEASGAGLDSVTASVNHRLAGNVENLRLAGPALQGTGNALDNRITGNALANILAGLSGDDHMSGGAGNDRLSGGDGRDRLAGGTGSDRLSGGAGADALDGGAGNDWIAGGTGGDTIDGGDGIDWVDYIDATAAVGVALPDHEGGVANEPEIDQLIGIENVRGSAFGDYIQGDNGGNILSGLGGNDTLIGLTGDDELLGGGGDDVLTPDYSVAETDIVDGGGGLDTVRYIYFSGDITVDLTTGTTSGVGGDLLVGIESIEAGSGNDTLTAAAGGSASGGGGNDAIRVSGGGSASGNSGDDRLEGDAAGATRETLSGGVGADKFVLHLGTPAAQAADILLDFEAAEQLVISRSEFGLPLGLSMANFVNGAGPQSPTLAIPQFLLNQTTGALSYDRDGTDSVYAAIEIAELQGFTLSLGPGDIDLIA